MSNSKSMLSQTLQSITTIKLRQLQKQRDSFNGRKAKIIAQVNEAADEQSKVRLLLEGIANLHASNTEGNLEDVPDWELDEISGSFPLSNIRRFVEQSRYDPSVSASKLDEFQGQLHEILNQRSAKLEYADLYSRLLTEWLNSDAAIVPETPDTASLDGEFEVVEKQKERLHQLSEKFESVVFTPGDVDVEQIQQLLDGLFAGEDAAKALTMFRKRISEFGKRLADTSKPFTQDVLEWCISGLLQSNLLSDQKKNALDDFLKDKLVLAEIGDVLNMRFADLQNWSWDADDGIPVEPRRQLNGKYRVVMDEDILQSIFLHFISISWSVEFKAQLKNMLRNRDVWQWTQSMPRDEIEKGEFFLGRGAVPNDAGIARERQITYENDFFMCQLPSNVDVGNRGYDDEDDRPRKAKSPNIKQQLLRTVGTEVLVQRCLNRKVAVVQSDLQWFATSTSHETVDTILKFFGVQKIWRTFFRRYLEAPLRMVGLEGESANVRTRKRGVPIGHIFQKLFGELIIFTMDLAVNQEANMLLYRLHDDLWLCGDPAKCVKAWTTMERCAKILGLQFNQSKTGSAYLVDENDKDPHIQNTLPKGKVVLGFLELDAKTGQWAIDGNQVDAHVKQLGKQLEGCTSIFSWIQTWNSCIGRFFNYTFGQPANCFGQRHVKMILDTHRMMQQKLFGNPEYGQAKHNSVTEHLRKSINEHFGVADVPDAFLYFPEELGGLGVRNPFISFLVVRDQVLKDPETRMKEFLKDEREAYNKAKKDFEALNERDRLHRLQAILGKPSDRDFQGFIPVSASFNADGSKRNEDGSEGRKPGWAGPTDDAFLSFDEFTRYRETSSEPLRRAYNDLLLTPRNVDVQATNEVLVHLDHPSLEQRMVSWNGLSSDRKWLVQLYAKDAMRRFGGLAIVDQGLLPMGVMRALRKRKVVWQTVL